MYFVYKYRKAKSQEDAFNRALGLQRQARSPLVGEQASVKLYCETYEIYMKIAQNGLLRNEIRGQAAYNMYLLVKENKVALEPATYNGITLETSEKRLENLLIWSVNFGCSDAISELTDARPTFESSYLAEDTEYLTMKKESTMIVNLDTELNKVALEIASYEQERSELIEQSALLRAEAMKEKNRLTSLNNLHDVATQEVQQLNLEEASSESASSDSSMQDHNTQEGSPLIFSDALDSLEIKKSDAGLPKTLPKQRKAKSFQFKNCCVLL